LGEEILDGIEDRVQLRLRRIAERPVIDSRELLVAAEEAAREMAFGRLRADLLATNRAAAHLIGKTAPHATITKEGPELVFEWEPGFRQRQAQEVA